MERYDANLHTFPQYVLVEGVTKRSVGWNDGHTIALIKDFYVTGVRSRVCLPLAPLRVSLNYQPKGGNSSTARSDISDNVTLGELRRSLPSGLDGGWVTLVMQHY